MRRRDFLKFSGFAVTAVIAPFDSANAANGARLSSVDSMSLGTLLNELARRRESDKALDLAVSKVLDTARAIVKLEPIRRVYEYNDLGKYRTRLDGRAKYIQGATRQTFALAMSDVMATQSLSGELPIAAAAWRLSGGEEFGQRVLSQLRELGTWSPLQRPGWTCYVGGACPPPGGDGNWLASGFGIRAIADALEIVPRDAVPHELRATILSLLNKEIASIADDWHSQRPWYVRTNNAITNQWVLPTEGLIRACLVVGVDHVRAAYELGVTNLLKAFDAHGQAGEFEEGVSYASVTVNSMASAARAMAVAGDFRAVNHPYLGRFASWAVQHLQPAQMLINCFDCTINRHAHLRSLLELLIVITQNADVHWALNHCLGGPGHGLWGLLARVLAERSPQPPALYASYERATRVNWRSSWRDDAVGVWIRGGHALDQHDHNDRGHVNLIAHGKPILIEAGTPFYDHPRIHSHFSTGYGHNVLQIGMLSMDASNLKKPQPRGWQKDRTVAPLNVRRLDEQGGAVTLVGDACYDDLRRWRRSIQWDVRRVDVTDVVELSADFREFVLFRWHLGTTGPVRITTLSDARIMVDWPDAEIVFTASIALSVSSEMAPDATLSPPQEGRADQFHVCLIVRSRDKVKGLDLTSSIILRA